jgi:allantoin racemase
MIKIKVIIPASSSEFLIDNKESRIMMAKGLVQVDVVNLPDGPASIESSVDVAQTTKPLVEAAIQAEKDGFDAITIDCAADPSLRAVKEAVSIPVCGAGEASYMTAMQLCQQFSVIAVLDRTTHLIRQNIAVYGLNQRVKDVRSVGIPVLELQGEHVFQALLNESKAAIKSGAGAIVLGCSGMSSQAKPLEQALGVPVIDPAAAAIEMATALAMGERKISSIDFPK